MASLQDRTSLGIASMSRVCVCVCVCVCPQIGPDHVPGLLRRTRTLVFKWYAYLRSQVSRVDWESVVEVHH